ncbi:MAG: hypothetical protein JXR95_05970 [Deltaproteobacteria bacterium]|nr:hypothetical protein [Deltaproteobacteria bacterium]
MRKLVTFMSVVALSAATMLSGCVVSARPATVSYSYGGWNAQYYNGALVYYDTMGRPYYYTSGVRYYVPATWYGYSRLVNHYRVHRSAYLRWHTRYHRPRHFRYRRRATVRTRGRVVRRTTHRRRTVRRVRARRRR